MILSIFIAILIYGVLGFFLVSTLHYISYKYHIKENAIIEKIDQLLPQSQCGQCNYPSCLSYAKAMIEQNEKIDKCIPGGKEVFLNLHDMLNINVEKYDIKKILMSKPITSIVKIDEKNCVGCAKCLYICPVDAIVGAPNLMHTILIDICTGCNLCISVCPTDCIYIKNDINEIDAFF